jgi:hypothetical protein
MRSRLVRSYRSVFGEELTGYAGIGGVQQQAEGVYFGESVRPRAVSRSFGLELKRDGVVDRLADRKATLLVRFK